MNIQANIEHTRTALDYINKGIQCSSDLNEVKTYIQNLTTALEDILDIFSELQHKQ